MDQNGRPAVQVVINGYDQTQAYRSNMHLQNQPRPLSVDEALKYSSMSSAPVFGLGLSTRILLLNGSQLTDGLFAQTVSFTLTLGDPQIPPRSTTYYKKAVRR